MNLHSTGKYLPSNLPAFSSVLCRSLPLIQYSRLILLLVLTWDKDLTALNPLW